MMMQADFLSISNALAALYEKRFGQKALSITAFPACGSDRRYYRMDAAEGVLPSSVIGTWNADKRENAAFVSFAQSFKAARLNVPEIYAVDEALGIYLQQDLGTSTLFALLEKDWLPFVPETNAVFPVYLENLYRKSLNALVDMQLKGKEVIDYSLCTPCPAFHRDAIHWDLNYFKYFFLKLLRVPFGEQALEDDFRTFSACLLEVPCDYFLFRDFQSANIMLKDDDVYFIDFQGGRKGALQYDPASLLFDAKARLPKTIRQSLALYYEDCLTDRTKINRKDFRSYYQAYALCRLLQALGAFGFRGVVENKAGFKESIPPALEMIAEIEQEWCIPKAMPELKACLRRMQSVCRVV